ncbi:hypothetical protein, partial [Hydrogenimonas thermophila]
MKMLLDNKQELTNIFKEQDINNATVINTAADAISRYLNDKNDIEIILQNISTKEAKTKEDVLKQYNEIVQLVKNDTEIQKLFSIDFQKNLKNLRQINSLDLQKVTYQVEDNEKFDEIVEALKNQESGAILRAIEADKENKQITMYSSTYGLWSADNQLFFKQIEALSKQQNKIRATYTLRKITNIEEKQDFKKLNYAIFEDLKTLFENNKIEKFYKSMQQLDNNWKDDNINYYIDAKFLKEDLSNEDFKEIETKKEALKNIKEQTTHTNKKSATKEELKATIAQNEKELHTTYTIDLNNVEQLDEIKAEKENIIKSYEERILRELEERQKREFEELKLKIEMAQQEREKAKKTYLNSLKNGNTIIEAVKNLEANKYNDVVVNEVLEDVKSEILLSVKKDEIINTTKKELETTTKKLKSTTKKLEIAEQARETNYKNYLSELEKRKNTENVLRKSLETAEKLKNTIIVKNSEIADLKEEIQERDAEIESLNISIEELEADNSKLNNNIAELNNVIDTKNNE